VKFLAQDAFDNLHTPLSLIASSQLQELAALIQTLSFQDQLHDCWCYIWGSGVFSSKKAYQALKGTLQVSALYKWLWKSCVRGKHKFFYWLLLKD
jgi:hypothetical protein